MIIDQRDIMQAVRQMPPPPEAAHIVSTADIKQKVIDAFHSNDDEYVGLPIQFPSFDKLMRFRQGEVTVLSGENFTGKSELLNQLILYHVTRAKAFIVSPEMLVFRTMHNMTCQALAKGLPTEREISDFLDFAHNQIYLLDQQSSFTPAMLINLIRYVKDVYDVDFVVIDSLMKCGMDENSEHEKVKWFIDNLCITAKNLGIHIFLVAHNKKPLQGQKPSKYDTKGSGSISDLADNSLIMWRNFAKEDALMEGCDRAEAEEWEQKPDAKIIIDKQRTTGKRGFIKLWHWPEQRVFLDSKEAIPQRISMVRAA